MINTRTYVRSIQRVIFENNILAIGIKTCLRIFQIDIKNIDMTEKLKEQKMKIQRAEILVKKGEQSKNIFLLNTLR